MSINRMRRLLTPCIALLALAVALVIMGMAVAGPAAAASSDDASPGGVTIQTRDAILEFGDPVRVALDERVGSVVSFGGDVTVAGTVTRTIVSFGGDVLLLPTARVGGALAETDASVVSFGGTITAREGAQVTGGLERVEEGDWARALDVPVPNLGDMGSWVGFSFIGWLVQTALFLVLGLVGAALLPKQMVAVGRALSVRPGASIGWGALAFFFVVPAVALVLLISIIGILLSDPGDSGRSSRLLLRHRLGGGVHRAAAHVRVRTQAEPHAGHGAGRRRHDHRLAHPCGRGAGAAGHDAVRHWRGDPRGARVAARPQDDQRSRACRRVQSGISARKARPSPAARRRHRLSGTCRAPARLPSQQSCRWQPRAGPDGGTAITRGRGLRGGEEPATGARTPGQRPSRSPALGRRSEEPDPGSTAPEAAGESSPEGR